MKTPLSLSPLSLLIVLACTLASAQADTFYYDDAGRLSSVTQSSGLTHTYSCDEENNLLSASHSGTASAGVPDWWGNYYFGAGGVNPLGNPAHDGMSNLMKYALGLNPNATNSEAPFNVSYQGYTDGKTYPYLTYIRSSDAALTLGFQMQLSTDLSTWQLQSQTFQQVGTTTDLGDGTEQLTLRCLTPVTGSPKLFFRLQVTTP